MLKKPREKLALAFILVTVTLDTIGIGLIFPVLPQLIDRVTEGGIARAALWSGVLATSFAVMQFLCGPLMGGGSDRFGRRPFDLTRANPLSALNALARMPGLRSPLLVFLIMAIAMNVYATIWAYYGITAFGWSSGTVGLSLAIYGVSFAIGQALLVAPALRILGEDRTVWLGMIFDIVSLVLLGVLTSGLAVLILIPFTALGGVVTPALQAIMSREVNANAQGELQGVLASLNAIAMILSPLVMTWVFARFTTNPDQIFLPGAPFLLAAALMTVAVILYLARSKSRSARPA